MKGNEGENLLRDMVDVGSALTGVITKERTEHGSRL